MKICAEEESVLPVVEQNLRSWSTSQVGIDRLGEYAVDACEDLFHVDGQSWLDAYNPQTIAYLLENEARFKSEWEQQLEEYYAARDDRDIPVVLRNNSKPQLPEWLYPQMGQEAAYRSIRKNLMIAMNKRGDEAEVEQIFWEMRQYLKLSKQAPVEGGPLELQKKGRYDDLLELCQNDMNSLPAILPEDQKADSWWYSRVIFRFRKKYFVEGDTLVDGKPILVTRSRWRLSLQPLQRLV